MLQKNELKLINVFLRVLRRGVCTCWWCYSDKYGTTTWSAVIVSSRSTAPPQQTSAHILEVVARVSIGLGFTVNCKQNIRYTYTYMQMGNKNFDFRYSYTLTGSWVRTECLDIHGKTEVLGGHASIHVVSAVHPVPETYLVWFPQHEGMEWPFIQVQYPWQFSTIFQLAPSGCPIQGSKQTNETTSFISKFNNINCIYMG